jgi:hypothetical protein
LAFEFWAERGGQRDIEAFLTVRQAPVEREVSSFIKQADAVVYNWRGKAEFREVLRQLFGARGDSE